MKLKKGRGIRRGEERATDAYRKKEIRKRAIDR